MDTRFRDACASTRPLVPVALLVALAACGGEGGGEGASAANGSGDGAPAAGARAAGDTTCAELASVDPDSMRATDSGLRILRLAEGTGEEASSGDQVTVHYLGCLTDGTKFDSSYDRSQPFGFRLGAGRVIPGWDEGVPGMKTGGVRILRIPPELGYGARGTPDGTIPPDATLLFRVELLEVTAGGGAATG